MNIIITEKPFGIYENKPVTEYTLRNANGMEMSVINYGATITRIVTPDRDGNEGNLVIGFDDLDGYLKYSAHYFGSIVGRFCNRIGNASFNLDGSTYQLAKNDGNNSLHGGMKGFDKAWWNIEKDPASGSLILTYFSKDGEEGFPGNLNVEVKYTLTAENALVITYTATSDKATPVNLTSHCYFNLSGGETSTVLGQELTLFADQYTVTNGECIPTGEIAPVKDSPFDFTEAKKIGKEIPPGGYDHNYVLNKDSNKVATVYDPVTGRFMEMFSTEPGVQFYSGNFLHALGSGSKTEKEYVQHAAFCLEAQHFPNSPNEASFPNCILRPGEIYTQITTYRFSVK